MSILHDILGQAWPRHTVAPWLTGIWRSSLSRESWLEIRRVTGSTNALESHDANYRRAGKARGHFPARPAALQCLYLATMPKFLDVILRAEKLVYLEPQRQRSKVSHPPQPSRSLRASRWTWLWLSVGLLSILISACAVYTAFGVSEFFDYSAGLSRDDAELVKQHSTEDIAVGMLLPIDSVILFLLLTVVTALHVGARRSVFAITWMTRTGMLVTLGSFVLSFFKFSVFFPMLFSIIGFGVSTAGSPSDLHTPSPKDYVLSDVKLINYTSHANRVTASIKNTSSYDWESATIDVILKDAVGETCYATNQNLKYVGKGEVAQLVTGRIDTYRLSQPKCGVTAATVAVTGFDVDSRSAKAPENYAHETPVFRSLKPLLEPDTFGLLRASVSGVVDRTSLKQPDLKTERLDASKFMFELVRTDGVRLDMCFKPKMIAPNGTFITGQYHSPVGQSEIASAVFVPNCDGS